MNRSKVVELTVLDVRRTTVLPADWSTRTADERIDWLTSWANDAITDTVIDTDGGWE